MSDYDNDYHEDHGYDDDHGDGYDDKYDYSESNCCSLDDYSPHGHDDLSDSEKDMLKFALGDRVCDTSTVNQAFDNWALAIIAVILFIVLSLESVDYWLSHYVKTYNQRLLLKALIFFFIILILDTLIDNNRKNSNYCK